MIIKENKNIKNNKKSKNSDVEPKKQESAFGKIGSLFKKFLKTFESKPATKNNTENLGVNKVSNNINYNEKNTDEIENFSSKTDSINNINNIDNTINANIKNTDEKKETKILSNLKFLNHKNVKLALLIIVIGIVLLVTINGLNFSVKSSSETDSENFNNISYISSLEYSEKLENKLINVLKTIEGVGNVSCMITLESGPELKIATSVDEKTTTITNDDKTETVVTIVETPIIVTEKGEEKPLILMEIMPKLKGVVVVAQGAKDVKVKLQLLEAVQALLEISSENIQIFSGI